LINEWHKQRGFDEIGYHFVILNGYPTAASFRLKQPQFWLDGTVQNGRSVDKIGAHAKGYNKYSIGVCLIGKNQFTMSQFDALSRLIRNLLQQHRDSHIIGHFEIDKNRTCPNLDINWIRELLKEQK
jgi:N-acetylmuramoyl-L-alanine amidase